MARICSPGGRILVVAWCHRDLEKDEAELTPREEKLLKRFYVLRPIRLGLGIMESSQSWIQGDPASQSPCILGAFICRLKLTLER